MRCLRPNPVVPLRFTTGYQLPSLRLAEIETACRKMRFIKLELMGCQRRLADRFHPILYILFILSHFFRRSP